jgi:plasmid maintenance system antidote protein VapI
MKKLNHRLNRKPEHILVRVKNELNLSQAEIPEHLGIPLATFKNIVHGVVKRWDEHAKKISHTTGIAVKCLLENNPRKPLQTTDGKQWTAQEYAPGIAWRTVLDVVLERSRGRHTLQWFRIVMIKVCRCMLAAYRDKKSGDAFVKLLQAICEVGKSFPSFTAKVPCKPGEPLQYEVVPGGGQVLLTERCLSQDWDYKMQVDVGAIPSTLNDGIIKIFDAFLKEVLAEEKKQGEKLKFALPEATRKAESVADRFKPAKPSRR